MFTSMNLRTPNDKQSSMLARLTDSNRHRMQLSTRKGYPMIEELSKCPARREETENRAGGQ